MISHFCLTVIDDHHTDLARSDVCDGLYLSKLRDRLHLYHLRIDFALLLGLDRHVRNHEQTRRHPHDQLRVVGE